MTDVQQDSAIGHVAEDTGRSVFSIGVIPWPIFLVLLLVLGGFIWLGKLPSDISLMIALLGVGGFACGELGKRIPII